MTGKAIAVSVISGVALFIAYLNYDSYRGKDAVAQMCKLDGGLRIAETVYAPGYLDDTNTIGAVSLIVETLLAYDYGYIDFANLRGGGAAFPLLEESGYFRASLRNISDPLCLFDAGSKNRILGTFERFGLPPDVCVAVERLPSRPAGYVYSQEFRRTASVTGRVLGVFEQVIRSEPSGKVLATNRDYLFTAKATRWLDMSGGGGRTDATCPEAQEFRFDSERLLNRVLRDTSKQKGSAR